VNFEIRADGKGVSGELFEGVATIDGFVIKESK
jgi:hypothetical protein